MADARLKHRAPIGARVAAVCLAFSAAAGVRAQDLVSRLDLTQRGSLEMRGVCFPQDASNDPVNIVADFIARDEVSLRPARWLLLSAGGEFRANSHDQVDDRWRVDFADRGVLRPRLAVTRAQATLSWRWLTVDAGKQFVRWGRTDVVTPADRFAPRDFLDVVESQFLAVTAGRAVLQAGEDDAIEIVWVPRFTPSRMPLLSQRWTVVPPQAAGVPIVDITAALPDGSQSGIRWRHVGGAVDYAVSFFSGFNHLPDLDTHVSLQPLEIQIARRYPRIRSYEGDAAVPLRWITVKGEASYVTSPDATSDEYVLYVIELERQTGEWVFIGGYAGDAVTERRAQLPFAPDRGLARSIVGRVAYTIDPNRSFSVETAVRQTGDGVWTTMEYSEAYGAHLRATVRGTVIGGHSDDFLGQFRRNSHLALTLRYSF